MTKKRIQIENALNIRFMNIMNLGMIYPNR